VEGRITKEQLCEALAGDFERMLEQTVEALKIGHSRGISSTTAKSLCVTRPAYSGRNCSRRPWSFAVNAKLFPPTGPDGQSVLWRKQGRANDSCHHH